MSAESVINALKIAGYQVIEIGITHDGQWLVGEYTLTAFQTGNISGLTPIIIKPAPDAGRLYHAGTCECIGQVDVAFPVLHGTFGEDGTIQGLFELADIAYVGSGVLASSVGMDKALFKDLMRNFGVPVVDSILITRAELASDPEHCMQRVTDWGSYPIFVKPANLGSSVGISKVHTSAELLPALHTAARYDRRILVERAVDPREIEVSILGNLSPKASLPGEIIPAEAFYSYHAKYMDNSTRLIIPAPLTAQQTARAQQLAIKAFQAVDGAGLARVDFLLDKTTDQLYVSEINTMPGFTRISMYPKLWEASGVSYADLVMQLVHLAQERKSDRVQTSYTYGGNE